MMGCLVIIGSIFQLLNFLQYIAVAKYFEDVFYAYIGVGIVSALLYCYPSFLYIRFFANDDYDTRNGVVQGQFAIIFLAAWISIW